MSWQTRKEILIKTYLPCKPESPGKPLKLYRQTALSPFLIVLRTTDKMFAG